MASVLEDNLNDELKEEDARIIVQQAYEYTASQTIKPRSKSFGNAKNLNEVYQLFQDAVVDYQNRASVPDNERIIFTEEDPDINSETETITFSLVRREPGAFGQGAPFESKTRNLRGIMREEGTDPQEPGYRYMVYGYWYDNIVRLTCWARTNKRANYRAMWLEEVMDEYAWWFKLQGIDRVLFWGRQSDITIERDSNKWYGRPIDFFVRTEKLRVFNEKTLEEIYVNLTVKNK